MANLLAIDQGTSSSRAILFNDQGEMLGSAQQEFTQHFPQDGWVEHDPEDIWSSTLKVVRQVLATTGISAREVNGIGITNQRETTIVWDRRTGKPIHNAIVWQDRRTAEHCAELAAEGLEPWIAGKTGLLLDPYFSATKLKWLLDKVPGARQKVDDLLFGTVDSFLLWRLTSGRSHKTDATNASRTLLFNIHEQHWDQDILDRLNIPASLLPSVEDSAAEFGETDPDLFGAAIPVLGIAGDQQAALIGQACFAPGMTKSTYGTGCFVIMNTGSKPIASQHKLLTTVAYRLGGQVTYGLEGSIFIAGAAVQWLRDGLEIISHAADTEMIVRQHLAARQAQDHTRLNKSLAETSSESMKIADQESARSSLNKELADSSNQSGQVYLVPAFTGLGAPYWDPNARGAIFGLTRDTGKADLVMATLDAVCFQTRDLLAAMQQDGAVPTRLRIDGGMAANNWLAERLADLLQMQVDRPRVIETTALGAAGLAGLQAGIFADLQALADSWQLGRHFAPQMSPEASHQLHEGWLDAVARVRS